MSCVSVAVLGAVRLLSPGTMKQRKISKSLFLLSTNVRTVLKLVYVVKTFLHKSLDRMEQQCCETWESQRGGKLFQSIHNITLTVLNISILRERCPVNLVFTTGMRRPIWECLSLISLFRCVCSLGPIFVSCFFLCTNRMDGPYNTEPRYLSQIRSYWTNVAFQMDAELIGTVSSWLNLYRI
jgi:hypothetical protein